MSNNFYQITEDLLKLIRDRQKRKPEDSYTARLFFKGIPQIAKKVGEESTEVVIASLRGVKKDQVYELADLWYHLLVLLVSEKISLEEVAKELQRRYKKF